MAPRKNSTAIPLGKTPWSRGLRRLLSATVILTLLFGLLPPLAFADSGYVANADIKRDPLSNVRGLGSANASGIGGTSSRPSFSVDPSTGSATYSYPLSIPPGRGNLTPPLALTYNSQSKNNFGFVGYGWDLSQSYIVRSDRQGVNHLYDDTNEFNFSLFGEGGELVATALTDDSHGEYGKLIEETFNRYEYNTDESWTVTTQDGTQYTFGAGSDTRQTDPDDSTRTYKWMLEEATDLNGNTLRFEYTQDENQIYPSAIYYTGYGGSDDGPFTVTFSYESRDDTMVSYRSGFRVQTRYRLNQIQAAADGTSAEHVWDLTYTTGENDTRSLLSSLTESATNAAGETTALPATTFTYSAYEGTWEEINGGADTLEVEFISSGGDALGNQFIDVNGDGYADVYASTLEDQSAATAAGVPNNCDQSGYLCYDMSDPTVFIHSGDTEVDSWRFENFDEIWQENADWDPDLSLSENDTTLLDLNGDALPDIYQRQYTSGTRVTGWRLNSGEGWADSLTALIGSTQDNHERYVDVNGDGLVDIVKWAYDGSVYESAVSDPGNNIIQFNTGQMEWDASATNWDLPFPTALFDGVSTYTDSGMRFVDANGDGMMDIALAIYYDDTDPDSTTDLILQKLYLNNGKDGWEEETGWSLPGVFTTVTYSYVWLGSGVGNSCLYDLNQDGLIDWKNGGVNNGTNAWENSASEDSPQCGGDANVTTGDAYSYRLEDLNADGVMDELFTGESEPETLRMSTASNTPDLLETIENSQGGTIDVSYELSTQLKDADENLLNPNLPFPVTVVSEVAYQDGLGDTVTTTYIYSGGRYYRYDSFRSEFAGFSEVTETTGDRVTTYAFDQGCETGDVCSSAFYADGTVMTGITSGGQWIMDGGRKRAYEFPSTDYWEKLQVVEEEVLNNAETGDSWFTDQEFHYDADLSNYALKGRMLSKEVATTSGAVYSREFQNWEVTDLGDQRVFPHLETNVTLGFEGGGDHRDIAWRYTYDESTGRVTQKEELGNVTADGDTGSLSSEVSGDERTTAYTYDTDTGAWLVTLTDEILYDENDVQMNAKAYTYDSNGNLTAVAQWLDTDGSWLTTTFTVNAYGLVTATTDPRGYTTSYAYDTYSLYPATVTDALGYETDFTYDYLTGQVATTTDPNGYTYTTTYDGFGRALTQSVPDPTTGASTLLTTTTYEDDASPIYAHQTTTVDGISSSSRSYFDGWSRAVEQWQSTETSSVYALTDTWYDDYGNIEEQTFPYEATITGWSNRDSTQVGTTYAYDVMNRPTSATTPVGMTTNDYSDADAWETTVTDANGNVKTYTYDDYQRLVRVDEVDADASSTYTTTYDYNGLNLLTQTTDTQNNIRIFDYDSLGRKTSETDPHRSTTSYGTWTYTYDANGNRTAQTDPNGDTIAWSYDARSRLNAEDQSSDGTSDVIYVYDAATNGIGRLATVTATDLYIAYVYDALGNVTSESKTIAETTYETQTAYDTLGRPTSQTYPNDALTVTTTYNARGAAETVSETTYGTLVSNLDYSPLGQFEVISYGNGVTTTNTYDPNENHRLTQKVTTGIYDNDPDSSDNDGDGLTRGEEEGYGTDLDYPDTDGDGLNDGAEIETYGTDPLALNSDVYHDTDDDGSFGVSYGEGENVAMGQAVTTAIGDGSNLCSPSDQPAGCWPANLADGDTGTLAYPGAVNFDYTVALASSAFLESILLYWGYYGATAGYIDSWSLVATLDDGTEVTLASGDSVPDANQTLVVLAEAMQTLPIESLRIYSYYNTNQVGMYELAAYAPFVDTDADDDGVANDADLCDDTAPRDASDTVDSTGCALSQKDTDSDGLTDYQETVTYGTDPLNYEGTVYHDTDGDGDFGISYGAGATVTAGKSVSSAIYEAYPAYSGANLVDGDTSTLALAGAVHFDYSIDLVGSYSLESTLLYWGTYGTTPGYLESWTLIATLDDGTEVTLATESALPNALQSLVFLSDGAHNLPITSLRIYSYYNTNWLGLYEFEAYAFSTDYDGDGVANASDLCDDTAPLDASDTIDSTGCALSQKDTDADGLSDYAESITHGTDPNDADTDNDLLEDGDEVNTYGTNPIKRDTDGDRLSDGQEVNRYGTNPLLRDTDGDRLSDGQEVNTYGTNPLVRDTDGDRLTDSQEVNTYLTDPLDSDTDDDGRNDGAEVRNGRDPLDPLARLFEEVRGMDGALAIRADQVSLKLLARFFEGVRRGGEWMTESWGDLAWSVPTAYATQTSGDIQNLSYTYDPVGNITTLVDASLTPTAKTMTYDYDSLYRLSSADRTNGFLPDDWTETYAYDSIGNLTYKSDIGSLTYGGTGYPGPHAVTNAQGQGYVYDANGNVLADGSNTYTWNIKNQLESVTTSEGAVWSYTYDPFGTRLTATNETTGETTVYVSPTMEVRPDEAIYYVYAGGQRVASVSVPHESGSSSDLSTLVLGDPSTDGTLTYYHQDHLGGTQVTTDQYGVVTQVYDYYPYGSELLDENLGAPEVPYSFTGKELNDDTGLYYFEARWYDPTIGRFMSADPMQYMGPERLLKDPQRLNAYTYSGNNPLILVDPTGEEWYNPNTWSPGNKLAAQGVRQLVVSVTLIYGGIASAPATMGASVTVVPLAVAEMPVAISNIAIGLSAEEGEDVQAVPSMYPSISDVSGSEIIIDTGFLGMVADEFLDGLEEHFAPSQENGDESSENSNSSNQVSTVANTTASGTTNSQENQAQPSQANYAEHQSGGGRRSG